MDGKGGGYYFRDGREEGYYFRGRREGWGVTIVGMGFII